jgi:hypothetical protein
VCHGAFFQSDIPTNIALREIRSREQFIHSRLNRKASLPELKDLTDFMHGFAAPNDPGIMAQLLPRYVQAFRNKEPGFRHLLRPHAEVLEAGSHLGAFLQVAEEWNWRATGLDVGSDTAGFTQSTGLTV